MRIYTCTKTLIHIRIHAGKLQCKEHTLVSWCTLLCMLHVCVPPCSFAYLSSPIPVRGPEPSRRISLPIFMSDTASVFSVALACTTASAAPMSANLFAEVIKGRPINKMGFKLLYSRFETWVQLHPAPIGAGIRSKTHLKSRFWRHFESLNCFDVMMCDLLQLLAFKMAPRLNYWPVLRLISAATVTSYPASVFSPTRAYT